MLQRRGVLVLVLVLVAAVAALVAVVANDRRAAAEWDTDCAEPTQVYDESNMPADLNLVSTDIVLFESGRFTGSVNSQGATICVAGPAAFDPTNINGFTRLFVRGTALMPPLAAESGALLDNEGSVRFLPQVNVNGLATVINRAGATIVVEGQGLSLPQGATVTNDGTITVDGLVNLNGSTVTNNNVVTIGGALTMSGTFTNTGDMDVGGVLTLNGNGLLVNSCSLTAAGLIANDDVQNSGVIQLGTFELRINGGATYAQTASGFTGGGDFINSGSVSGQGQHLFSGQTLNNTVVTGDGPDTPIVFFDSSPNGEIFDVNNGTATNVVRQEVTPPDPGACTITPPTTTTTSTTSTTTTSTTTTTTTLPPTTTSTTSTTTTTEPPTTVPSPTRPPTTTTTTTEPSTSSTSSSTSTASTTTTTEPPASSTSSSTTTSTTTPSGVAPSSSVSSTTTSTTTTTTVPPYVGTLPSTGGRQVDGSIAAAILLTLAGTVLVVFARPRRG